MKRDDPRVTGKQADQLFRNPAFMHAWESQYQEAIKTLETIDTTNAVEALDAIRHLQTVVGFKRALVKLIRAGDLAAQRDERSNQEVTPLQAGHLRKG